MREFWYRGFSILSIAFILMMTIFQNMLFPLGVSAAELNQSGIVDSFHMKQTELRHGDRTKIEVTYSDKNDMMKSGDTLTLQVPENLETFKGTTIPLNNDQGTNFGSCEISQGQVVCTFNDTVEELNNVRGSFYFMVQAGSVSAGTTEEYETNLGTNLAKQPYSITAPEGGTSPGVFFYKTGDMQPSNPHHVRWFLNANLKKEYLNDDIIIKDRIGQGQEIKEDSFRITVDYWNGNAFSLTKKEFEDRGFGKITIHDNTNFDVVIYKDKASANAFSIAYKTAITDAGESIDLFKNEYELAYQVLNQDRVEKTDTFTVENIDQGGESEGDFPPAGTVRLFKTVSGNEEIPLSGVKFNVYKQDDTLVAEDKVTGEDGKVEVSNLQPGSYYAQEIEAPEYVEFDQNKRIPFMIKSGVEQGIEIPVQNQIKTTSVDVEKMWKGDETEKVTVNLLADGEKVADVELSDKNNWKHTFTELPVVHDIKDE
ncbi:hypothetical protein CAI16_16645, partial [Virgibacillus dokdonensis]